MSDDDTSQHGRGWLPASLAGASAMLLATLAVVTNQATALLPKHWAWLNMTWLWWTLVALLSVAVASLATWQLRVANRGSAGAKSTIDRVAQPSGSDRNQMMQHDFEVSGGTVINAVRTKHFTLNSPSAIPPDKSRDADLSPAIASSDHLWNIPPPVHSFIDRESVIAAMTAQFWESSKGSTAIALHGISGVGKTQVARAYAHRHLGKYKLGWWVPAESVSATEANLAELAIKLGARADLSSKQLVIQLNVLLADRSNWLLVFDNSANPSDLESFLPNANRGHILITSRTKSWAGIAEPISVDLLPMEAAVELLEVRTRDTDSSSARQLAEELGRLSLALEQAAAYCAEYEISVAQYLELFRTRRRDLLGRGKPLAYEGNVDTSYSLLIEEIRDKNRASVQLLEVCSLLAPDSIPISLLLDHPQYLRQELADAAGDALRRNDMLGNLYRTGLLAQDVDGSARIHRLVRDVTLDRMQPMERNVITTKTVDLLVELFPKEPGNLVNRSSCAQMVSHATALILNAYAQNETSTAFATLLDRVAYYLLVWTTDLQGAGAFQEHALNIRLQANPSDDPDTATSLNGLATTMRHMGQLQRSRELHERALAIHRNVHADDHPDTATTLTDLSYTCSRLGDGEAAFRYGEEALAMRRRLQDGGDNMDIVTSLNDLSVALRQLGNPSHALQLNEEALAMSRRLYDGDHPETAQSLFELGITLRQLGDLARSRTFAQQALAMRQNLHQDDHRHTARSMHDLAITLGRMGELGGARVLLEGALRMRERLHPGDHPETARNLYDLGLIENELGDIQIGADWTRQAADMRTRLRLHLPEPKAWQ